MRHAISRLLSTPARERLRTMTNRIRRLALSAIVGSGIVSCLLGSTQASAENHYISLTGMTANVFSSSQELGGFRTDSWDLQLDSLPPEMAPTVAEGDSVNAVVQLVERLTIPAANPLTFHHLFIGLYLHGSAFPDVDTLTSGSTTIIDSGISVLDGASSSSSRGVLVSALVSFQANAAPISFDALTSVFNVITLSTPTVIDSASISISMVSSVPEPTTCALMLAGLGLVGAITRTRSAAARA